MALFDINIVRGVALVIVLISCMALTDSSIACNSDPEACRYDCSTEVIQNHNCTSGKVFPVHDAVKGKCCPGHFKTENNECQVCPDVYFMPDVNNCCECLLCSECEGMNNTIVTRCGQTSHTSDTVCKIQDDPPSHAPTDCPWIESTSTATTQVPTSQVPTTDNEESTVDTPSDPQKSERTSLEKGFLVIVGPFIFLLVVFLLIGFCLCCAHHSGGTDQPDKGDKTWKVVATIVADETEQLNREVQTWKGVANIILEQPNGEVKTWKGDASIVAGGNDQTDGPDKTWKEVASIVAEKIRRSCAECRAACPCQPPNPPPNLPPNPPPNPPREEDHSNNNGHDEPHDRGPFMPREEN